MTKFFPLPAFKEETDIGRTTHIAWVNPAFFGFIEACRSLEELGKAPLLPVSIWAPIQPEHQSMFSLTLVKLIASEEPRNYGQVTVQRKGALHINSAFVAALIEHGLSGNGPQQFPATNVFLIDDKATKFADLKIFSVEGTPQDVAEKLGIDVSSPAP